MDDLIANIKAIDVAPKYYAVFVWLYLRDYLDSMPFAERNKFFALVGEVKADLEGSNEVSSQV